MTSIYERLLAQQKVAEDQKLKAWAKIMAQKMPEVGSEWHPRDHWPAQETKVEVVESPENSESGVVWFVDYSSRVKGTDGESVANFLTVYERAEDFYCTYYQAEEWDHQIQSRFPRVFALRAKDKCECCPSLSLGGVLSYHHRKRSSKEYTPASILARHMIVKIGEGNWPQPVAEGRSDEDVLLSELKKCVPVCRQCHDKIHDAEKKLKNQRAYDQYIDSLRQFEWLNLARIEELAKLSPE